jgi:hypothetical protein
MYKKYSFFTPGIEGDSGCDPYDGIDPYEIKPEF